MTDTTLTVDDATLEKLAVAGPRYTSYPTAPEWSDEVGEDQAHASYRAAFFNDTATTEIYTHLPFCRRLCLYCGCTVEISGRQDRADRYLDAVEREVALVSADLGERRGVAQMHWGGGTPTFLSVEQLRRLHGLITDAFHFVPGAEISIEVDPHVTTPEQVDCLFDLGFNRVSMGVQDLDPEVQTTVRRDQTADETLRLIEHCRARGVDGINVDLMYGLPSQTAEGFSNTVDTILKWRPDRLAVFGYAHVPWMKPAQKVLEKKIMPAPTERARLFGMALQTLTSSGYEVIGLDHFALATDELARCLHDGSLHRNFQGYATRPADDMVGFGMSAIGDIGGAFLQNARDTETYEARLAEGRLATVKGLVRSPEDDLRRSMILSLMCRMRVDLDELEAELGRSDLATHFAGEWAALRPFAEEGTWPWSSTSTSTAGGRLRGRRRRRTVPATGRGSARRSERGRP
jgi:oxygen-independent coproporphyrinogen-3 oxidase